MKLLDILMFALRESDFKNQSIIDGEECGSSTVAGICLSNISKIVSDKILRPIIKFAYQLIQDLSLEEKKISSNCFRHNPKRFF